MADYNNKKLLFLGENHYFDTHHEMNPNCNTIDLKCLLNADFQKIFCESLEGDHDKRTQFTLQPYINFAKIIKELNR